MGNSCNKVVEVNPVVTPQLRAPIKIALLIGCNYTGSGQDLHGCINDVNNMKEWLMTRDYQDITILVDDGSSALGPTRTNIFNQLASIASRAIAGDTVFLHYSGHGGQTVTLSADESDHQDETIYGSNNKKLEQIKDNDLRSNFVEKLAPGVKFRALFDSCHSASVLDLPYRYLSDKAQFNNESSQLRGTQNCVELSGCLDNETSADAYINARYQGVTTFAFLAVMKQNSTVSYAQLLAGVRAAVKSYNQTPQLCVGDKTLPDSIVDL